MEMNRRSLLLSAASLAFTHGIAHAQDYPAKPIKIVVPVTAGSGTDATARFVANALGKAWNTTVTVDNKRAGAVTVFAEHGLMFVRLGEVAAHQQETLRVPESLTKSKAAIRVYARPEGAATVSTKGLRVEQGDHIAVIVM